MMCCQGNNLTELLVSIYYGSYGHILTARVSNQINAKMIKQNFLIEAR